jgi:hypothetical protein
VRRLRQVLPAAFPMRFLGGVSFLLDTIYDRTKKPMKTCMTPNAPFGALLLRLALVGYWAVHWWFKVGFRGMPATVSLDSYPSAACACRKSLARLARSEVPREVESVYGRKLSFGCDYIIPTPFDPRLIIAVPPAVMKAAVDTGVARRPIRDLGDYQRGKSE